MTIFARNKAHCKNLPTFIISLVRNMVQNKATSDNIVSILDCVGGSLSEE
jgi:hypothetical protein